VTIQIPLYLALLGWNGATVEQMLASAGSVLLIAAVAGPPYGLFLAWGRRISGVDEGPKP